MLEWETLKFGFYSGFQAGIARLFLRSNLDSSTKNQRKSLISPHVVFQQNLASIDQFAFFIEIPEFGNSRRRVFELAELIARTFHKFQNWCLGLQQNGRRDPS